jgi:hypothetical protein
MGEHSEDVNSFTIRSKRMPSKHDWSKVSLYWSFGAFSEMMLIGNIFKEVI